MQEAMNIRHKEYTKRRNAHAARVLRNHDTFMMWYDRGAEMVFSGKSPSDALDELAPWGCDVTQSNGVQAGALQAGALLKNE